MKTIRTIRATAAAAGLAIPLSVLRNRRVGRNADLACGRNIPGQYRARLVGISGSGAEAGTRRTGASRP
jgi:hypothetical protein